MLRALCSPEAALKRKLFNKLFNHTSDLYSTINPQENLYAKLLTSDRLLEKLVRKKTTASLRRENSHYARSYKTFLCGTLNTY